MFQWFHRIQRIGVDPSMDKSMQRNIVLCNSLSLLIAAMPFLFALLVLIQVGSASITIPLITQPLLLLFPILLNALGFTTLSRILLGWITPLVIITYSIYNKSLGLDLETTSYVGFRITMVGSSILGFLVFSLKEKWLMLLSIIMSFAFILSFDLIHAAYGVSYSDVGLNDATYSLTNIRAFIGIIIIGSCALILKYLFEKSEHENEQYIDLLNEKNEKIGNQLQEITSQSENILLQKELIEKQYQEILQREADLIDGKNKLVLANKIIKSQQDLLQKENIHLEQKLLEQNVILEQTNKDLIQMNADLHQFTYMASHNLNGPIASLLGLFSIVPATKLDSELNDLLNKSMLSVQKLHNVVKDLNQIGNIENSLLRHQEEIIWKNLIDSILAQYEQEIKENKIQIQINCSNAPSIISIRSTLYSIMNNLVSNAIKFRSPERIPTIEITSRLAGDKVVLEISDNGLGMDLAQIGDKLFMMYKRFHNHVLGKGLGLFLTKSETEILGGTITVASEVNRFTTVTLAFPMEDNTK